MEETAKAQGSFEYLIIASAVLAIASVTVLFLTGIFGGSQSTASFGACMDAASLCKASKMVSPEDPCPQCDISCAGTSGTAGGKDIMTNNTGCGGACYLCKRGEPGRISNVVTPHELSSGSGLVGLWHFNEGSGTAAIDGSGKANTGTVIAAVWNSSAKFGNALSFDKTVKYVNVSDSASLDITNAITIEAWAKMFGYGGNTDNPILSKSTASADSYQLFYGWQRDFYCIIEGTSASYSPPVTIGVWHHLACTWDGQNITTFVDGLPVKSVIKTGTIAPNTHPLWIGRSERGLAYFNGTIDEVAIYNRAKPAWEIWVDANA